MYYTLDVDFSRETDLEARLYDFGDVVKVKKAKWAVMPFSHLNSPIRTEFFRLCFSEAEIPFR